MLVLCLCTLWFFVFFPMKFIFWKLYDTRDWWWVFVLIDGIKRPIVMPWWRNKHCFFSKLVFHSPLTLAQKCRKMLKKGSQGWKLVYLFLLNTHRRYEFPLLQEKCTFRKYMERHWLLTKHLNHWEEDPLEQVYLFKCSWQLQAFIRCRIHKLGLGAAPQFIKQFQLPAPPFFKTAFYSVWFPPPPQHRCHNVTHCHCWCLWSLWLFWSGCDERGVNLTMKQNGLTFILDNPFFFLTPADFTFFSV